MSYYYRQNMFPPVVKNLLIVNVLIFIAQETLGSNNPYVIENLFALHDVRSEFFKPHQVLTYMFLHGGFDHILFNMLALWMFGSVLENHWGSKRFLQYYIICGIGAGLLHLGVLYIEMTDAWNYIRMLPVDQQQKIIHSNDGMVISNTITGEVIKRVAVNTATLGASGSIFGLLAAFGYLFPNTMIYVYFMIPIKAKWFVLIYGAIELWLGIRNSAGDNVAHFAHLGGAITGLIIVYIWNKTNRKTFY